MDRQRTRATSALSRGPKPSRPWSAHPIPAVASWCRNPPPARPCTTAGPCRRDIPTTTTSDAHGVVRRRKLPSDQTLPAAWRGGLDSIVTKIMRECGCWLAGAKVTQVEIRQGLKGNKARAGFAAYLQAGHPRSRFQQLAEDGSNKLSFDQMRTAVEGYVEVLRNPAPAAETQTRRRRRGLITAAGQRVQRPELERGVLLQDAIEAEHLAHKLVTASGAESSDLIEAEKGRRMASLLRSCDPANCHKPAVEASLKSLQESKMLGAALWNIDDSDGRPDSQALAGSVSRLFDYLRQCDSHTLTPSSPVQVHRVGVAALRVACELMGYHISQEEAAEMVWQLDGGMQKNPYYCMSKRSIRMLDPTDKMPSSCRLPESIQKRQENPNSVERTFNLSFSEAELEAAVVKGHKGVGRGLFILCQWVAMLELQLLHGHDYDGDNGDELDLPQCFDTFHEVMERLRRAAAQIGGGQYNLQEMFSRFDTDNSGSVSGEELQAALNAMGVALTSRERNVIFAFLDLDGRNGLQFGELVYAFYNRREQPRISPAIMQLCVESRCSLQPQQAALAQALSSVRSLRDLCEATQAGSCSVGVVRRCLRSMHGARAVDKAIKARQLLQRVSLAQFFDLSVELAIPAARRKVPAGIASFLTLPRSMLPIGGSYELLGKRVQSYAQQCKTYDSIGRKRLREEKRQAQLAAAEKARLARVRKTERKVRVTLGPAFKFAFLMLCRRRMATTLQSCWRGHRARCRVALILLEQFVQMAVVPLQANVRARIAWKRYMKEKTAVRNLERWWSTVVWIRDLKGKVSEFKAIMVMQRATRKWVFRKRLRKQGIRRRTIEIQAWFRMRAAMWLTQKLRERLAWEERLAKGSAILVNLREQRAAKVLQAQIRQFLRRLMVQRVGYRWGVVRKNLSSYVLTLGLERSQKEARLPELERALNRAFLFRPHKVVHRIHYLNAFRSLHGGPQPLDREPESYFVAVRRAFLKFSTHMVAAPAKAFRFDKQQFHRMCQATGISSKLRSPLLDEIYKKASAPLPANSSDMKEPPAWCLHSSVQLTHLITMPFMEIEDKKKKQKEQGEAKPSKPSKPSRGGKKGKDDELPMMLDGFIEALTLISIHMYLHSYGAAKCGGSDECHWLSCEYWQMGLPDYGMLAWLDKGLATCFTRLMHEYVIPHLDGSPDVIAHQLSRTKSSLAVEDDSGPLVNEVLVKYTPVLKKLYKYYCDATSGMKNMSKSLQKQMGSGASDSKSDQMSVVEFLWMGQETDLARNFNLSATILLQVFINSNLEEIEDFLGGWIAGDLQGLLQMNFTEFELAMVQLSEGVKKHSTNSRFKAMGRPELLEYFLLKLVDSFPHDRLMDKFMPKSK